MNETRKISRTPEEIAHLREIREHYQREKPSPLQVLAEGGHEDFVPLGALLELHQAAAWLRAEREKQQMTLARLSELTGIDQAALSRLETGKNSNPTYETILRVASALGKVVRLTFQDAPPTFEREGAGV